MRGVLHRYFIGFKYVLTAPSGLQESWTVAVRASRLFGPTERADLDSVFEHLTSRRD